MRSTEPGASATSAELVAGIAALAAELAARPVSDSGAACYEQVVTLGRAVDLIESAIAARVTVASRAGQVAEWGHTSPTAWLRSSLGMRHVRAEERAVLAEQLPRLPRVAERLAAGDLSSGYAAAIASGVRRLDETDCGKAEDLLLRFVDDGHSVGQITRFADKIKDLIAERDGTAVEPEDGRRVERQWLKLHRSGTGAFVKGRFGPELMALIKAGLEPLAAPCGAQDTRDHAERLADALQTHLSKGDSRWDPIVVIELKQPVGSRPPERRPGATRPVVGQPARQPTGTPAAGSGVGPARTAGSCPAPPSGRAGGERLPGGGTRVELSHQGRGCDQGTPVEPDNPMAGQPADGAHPGTVTSDPGAVIGSALRHPASGWPFDGTRLTARLADGTPIPTERVRQILLNAGFSTLILGTDGHPLYLGRRVRCANSAQRRVALVRYATCVVDDCEIPATMCQIDHIDGWENGQPTDIDRLVPCCAFHNCFKWRHPDRVTIHQRPDGRYRYHIARPVDQGGRPGPSSDRGP